MNRRIIIPDAQSALGFINSQRTHIEAGVYETQYPDIQYPGLIPVDTSAPPWISTVTYYSSDRYGKADWVNGNADDIPLAGTVRSKFETAVHTAAIGYGWGVEELGVAMALGIPLQAEDARAARRAYEEMIDRIALAGDPSKNFNGLFDYPGITIGAPVANFNTATPQQMVDTLNNALMNIFNATNTVGLADTQLVPYSIYFKLANTRMGSGDSNETVLSFYLRTNVYTMQTGRPLTLRGLRGLDTAGESGARRIVTYRRSPEVLKMHLPMPLQFLPTWQAGPLRYEVPGLFRVGGVDIRLPKEVSYIDGA